MPFVKVGTTADIEPGKPLVFDLDYETIVLFQIGERYFCIEDVCSHQEVALSDGRVDGCKVECPKHGSWFDLESGKALNLPAVKPVKTYPIKVEGDDIFVEEPESPW